MSTPLEYRLDGVTFYILSEGGGKFNNLKINTTVFFSIAEPYHPEKEEYDNLVRAYDGDFDALGFPYTDDLTLYKANGCDKCANTGYKGRTGLHELLDGTDDMKNLIQVKSKMEILREQAVKDGMTTLMQDGIRKVFLGQTDIQQVRKVCIK